MLALQRIFKIQNVIRLIISFIIIILIASDLYNSFSKQDLYSQVYVGNTHFWQFDSVFALRLYLFFEVLITLFYLIFILTYFLKDKFSKTLVLFLLALDVIVISYFVFLYFYNLNNI